MSFIDDVATVTITRASVLPSRAGFGTPLLVGYHALNNDRVRSYSSLAGMSSDGFRSHDPIYKAAAAIFSQSPRPRTVKVGRRASAPTQVVQITPTTPILGEVFTVKVDGLAATFTAGAAPTVAQVCTGLQAALAALADVDAIVATGASSASLQTLTGATLDGATGYRAMSTARHITLTLSSHADWDATTATLTGKDIDGNTITESLTIPNGGNTTLTSTKRYRQVTSLAIPAQSGAGGTFTVGVSAPVTATDDTTHVTCTSPVAGEHHSFELVTYRAASTADFNLQLLDNTSDPGIAADMTAIYAANSDWYAALVCDGVSKAEALAAAAYVETLRRMLWVQTSDAGAASSSVVDDVLAALQAANYARTTGWYYPHLGLSSGQLVAAMLGRLLAYDPGSVTAANQSLSGVTVVALTDTQRDALEGKSGNYYAPIAGATGNTWPGKVSDNDWVDVVRDLDKLHSDLQTRMASTVRGPKKTPFTDSGISKVAGNLRGVLQGAVNAGILSSFTVTAPLASEVSSADKSARTLTGVSFSGVLAGAIHNVSLTGTVAD